MSKKRCSRCHSHLELSEFTLDHAICDVCISIKPRVYGSGTKKKKVIKKEDKYASQISELLYH